MWKPGDWARSLTSGTGTFKILIIPSDNRIQADKKPDPVNARGIIEALHEFGFGSVGLTAADFEQEGKIVQLGFPPVRVDIITSIHGVSWEQARAGK